MAKEELYEEESDRKIYRHKRRVRNQIICYAVLTVILAGLVTGGIIGIRKVITVLNDRKQAQELQKQLEELSGTEDQTPVVEAPTEPEPEAEVGEEDRMEELVENYIAEMPLEDKVKGLFMITPEVLTDTGVVIRAGDTTNEKLKENPVGGLIYASQNINDEAQLTEMLKNTADFCPYPIFLAVEEEGGEVSCVSKSDLAPDVGDMADIGGAGDPSAAQQAGSSIGGYLSTFGFNVDLAPVADVTAEENARIGKRSFGSDSNMVSSMVSSFVQGLQGSGVSACLKYFPGTGDVTENPQDGMAVTQKSLDDFAAADFPVYQAGIDAGADFVMVSQVSAPNVTGDNTPAALSEKMISEILRGQLGYQGIVITDAMNVKAVTEYYTSEEAAVKALQAGADMILMPEDFGAACDGVLNAVNDGTLTEERINESLKRIFRVKLRDRLE